MHDFKKRPSAHKRHWLTLVEHGFRPVDKLNYLIRRSAIEDYPGQINHSPSPHLMQTNARLSELQRAIGRCLVRQYDLTQPMPDRLVALLRKVEQPA